MFEVREVGLGVRKGCKGRVVMKVCWGGDQRFIPNELERFGIYEL